MADKQDTTPNGWTGQLFRNDWLNTNPLVASIQGYPYQVRGTDPASAKASLDWAASGMRSSAVAADGSKTGPGIDPSSILHPLDGIAGWLTEHGKAIAIGWTGMMVGTVLLAIGMVVLFWGPTKEIIKASAKA